MKSRWRADVLLQDLTPLSPRAMAPSCFRGLWNSLQKKVANKCTWIQEPKEKTRTGFMNGKA